MSASENFAGGNRLDYSNTGISIDAQGVGKTVEFKTNSFARLTIDDDDVSASSFTTNVENITIAGTYAMTKDSTASLRILPASTACVINLPDTSTIKLGREFEIINRNGTSVYEVRTFTNNTGLDRIPINTIAKFKCISTSINTGSGWSIRVVSEKARIQTNFGGTGLDDPGPVGNVLTSNGTIWESVTPGTGGTVTSVDMSVPSHLAISGNPITTSGTLAIGYSGTALPVANGGTGTTSAGAEDNVLTSISGTWTSTPKQLGVLRTLTGPLELITPTTPPVIIISNASSATTWLQLPDTSLLTVGRSWTFINKFSTGFVFTIETSTQAQLTTIPFESTVKVSVRTVGNNGATLGWDFCTISNNPTTPALLGGTGLSNPGTSGNVLTSNGTDWFSSTPANGTVTSVDASVPSVLSISGNPITSSGTLAIGYSGTALPVANGGTGTTSAGSFDNVLTSNGTSWISQEKKTGQTLVLDGTQINMTSTNPEHFEIDATSTASTNIILPSTVGLANGRTWTISNMFNTHIHQFFTSDISFLGQLREGESVSVTVINPGNNTTLGWSIKYLWKSSLLPVFRGGTGLFGPGTSGNVLTSNGTEWVSSTPTNGTVTSVDASVPSVLSISGNPITSSGTLAIGYSGTALPVANGGTGTTSAGAENSILVSNGTTLTSSDATSFRNRVLTSRAPGQAPKWSLAQSKTIFSSTAPLVIVPKPTGTVTITAQSSFQYWITEMLADPDNSDTPTKMCSGTFRLVVDTETGQDVNSGYFEITMPFTAVYSTGVPIVCSGVIGPATEGSAAWVGYMIAGDNVLRTSYNGIVPYPGMSIGATFNLVIL